MNVLELFAGIGGMSLGLERAGMTVVGQVEIDPYCRAVLDRHWPDVPKHDDVRGCTEWWQGEERPRVDLVAGGFPCQPVSQAGQRRGTVDKRWMWPAMAAVIRDLRPQYALMENVPGLFASGMGDVLADLAALGYDAQWDCIPAAAVGAPHRRDRVFIVAHAYRRRFDGSTERDRQTQSQLGEASLGDDPCGLRTDVADVEIHGRQQQRHHWSAEPNVGRVAHGVPRRVDRLRALGNAVVPQVAEHVGRLILDAHEQRRAAA